MRSIDCGIQCTHARCESGLNWGDLPVPAPWSRVISTLLAGSRPRVVQSLAIQQGLLDDRRNLIVSAPTNAGKSLVGLLPLLQAVRRGKRGIFLVPLRALAREKFEELKALAPKLADALGVELTVRISTGDYRIDNELYTDPPPGGELIVATPERMEALLRNPEYAPWFETMGATCVDEAHLIGSDHRGPTLEFLITSLLCLPAPPRLILLSATLGDLEEAQDWLAPCDVIRVTERQPPLHKWVLAVDDEEDANTVAIDWITAQLPEPTHQVLIFVYQTSSAEKLSRLLNDKLTAVEETELARCYHAQMSSTQREEVRQAFIAGAARIVVTTTALALGINLPATHVLVRDSTFYGSGRLSAAELLQMMGRAGRGDQEGTAAVLVRPGDGWHPEELCTALREEPLPGLQSAFAQQFAGRQRSEEPMAASHVASLLSRWGEKGATSDELRDFLGRSLGGRHLTSELPSAVDWLQDHTLAYEENGNHKLTTLGRKATRAVLPLSQAAGYARLLRDLQYIDPEDELLAQWRPLDHLLALDMLYDGSPSVRQYSQRLAEQVESWCEGNPGDVPLLFKQWIRGQEGYSSADQVLGSLRVDPRGTADAAVEWARKRGYQSTFNAIVLFERSQGVPVRDLERRFRIKNLEGVEERWRDDLLWLLAGVANLLEVPTFYYHLKEVCEADQERINRVERLLKEMQQQVYKLQEQIKYCSPLGALAYEVRRLTRGDGPKVGVQTFRRLEEAGITYLRDLVSLDVDDMVAIGVRRDLAQQIRSYVQRRLRA